MQTTEEYRKKHAARQRAWQKKKKENDPFYRVKVRNTVRRWKKANPDKVRAGAIRWRNKNYEKVLLKSAKDSAKRKGLEFNLELSDIVIPDICPVLGTPIIKAERKGGGRENGPSLDRRDNSLGYIKGNVFVISWRANRLKWNGTIEEFHRIIKYMTGS